jgi:23S rRNA pseudouridine1911/1915/1917 synthase
MSKVGLENIKIIYEDEFLVVINKPAGLVVNRAESVKEPTLQDWMDTKISNYDESSLNKADILFRERSGLVHRLDKETSGVMLMAKIPETMIMLMEQFKNREVNKEYVALVHGHVQPREGFVSLPIRRSLENRHRFVVEPFGKNSHTDYRVENYFLGYTLVRLMPKTGRTHQIRVHMKHIGYPLVADPLYLGKKRLAEDSAWCPRMFLHATSLQFKHPKTMSDVRFDAELASELQVALESLEENV